MTRVLQATPEDLDRLLPMVEAFEAEQGRMQDAAARAAALLPLLDGSALGRVYLAGPARAPVGYVVVTFGWSVSLGGRDATIATVFLRAPIRQRGIGSDVLRNVLSLLAQDGVRAVHLDLDPDNQATRRISERLHFAPRSDYMRLTRCL